MKQLTLAIGLFLTLLCAAGAASPAQNYGLRDTSAEQGFVHKAQTCQPGHYWCPGEISGCCPNGWGCGSRTCIRPGSSAPPPQAVAPNCTQWMRQTDGSDYRVCADLRGARYCEQCWSNGCSRVRCS